MDLTQIGPIALYSAIGGVLGGLVGTLLAMPFRKAPGGKAIGTVLTVICVLIGVFVANPLLSPMIGLQHGAPPQSRAAEAQLDDVLSELRGDPLFAALLDRESELETRVRTIFAEILEQKRTESEVRRLSFAASYEIVSERLGYYLQRGLEADILNYLDAVIGILEHLVIADPAFCHAYLYDADRLAAAGLPAMVSKIGAERFQRQQQAGASVVRNARDEIPVYDEQTAQLQLNMAGKFLFDLLGEERIGLVTAELKPANDEEARAACEASSGMMSMIRGGMMPANTFRHMMIQSAQT